MQRLYSHLPLIKKLILLMVSCPHGDSQGKDAFKAVARSHPHLLPADLSFIMSINYLYLYPFASCCFYGSITLWGSLMLSAYYNPRKCEYSRLCHLELILIII